jgi:hypothetical protein
LQVLQAWFLFKEEKQRKRKRCAEAMETRRQRLVREGVSQWTRVAAALAESRTKLAAQQQMQVSIGQDWPSGYSSICRKVHK